MEASKLFEGIALLIDLAQQGEIDPWDVRVIEVIDRYLSELIMAQEETQSAREADLCQSGQAFLSASMLVLFKANTLLDLEASAADPESEAVFVAETEDGLVSSRRRLPLEQQLRRRPSALPPQKRRVALKELIDQLQLMAKQLQLAQKQMTSKSLPTRRLSQQSRAQTARAIAQLAHQENLTEVAGELEQFLNRRSQLSPEQDWLNLDQLVDLWSQTKQPARVVTANKQDPEGATTRVSSSQHNDRVSVFWALLLLSAQSKVELYQEEFYQDIKIRTLDAK